MATLAESIAAGPYGGTSPTTRDCSSVHVCLRRGKRNNLLGCESEFLLLLAEVQNTISMYASLDLLQFYRRLLEREKERELRLERLSLYDCTWLRRLR